jgi:hypothetical protein
LRWSRRLLIALTAVVALGACTRALVPIGIPAAPQTAIAESTLDAGGIVPEGDASFSVFGVPPGGHLMVREPAGISGTVVAELPADLRNIGLTGQATPLGSSIWVEILVPSGTTGWINLWNLTEDIESQAFCQDPRVPALIDTFFAALRDRSGDSLAETISPRRGLVLRHDWWNDEIVIPLPEVPDLMQRVDEIAWGVQRGSGAPIVGSFRDRLLPELDTCWPGTGSLQSAARRRHGDHRRVARRVRQDELRQLPPAGSRAGAEVQLAKLGSRR